MVRRRRAIAGRCYRVHGQSSSAASAGGVTARIKGPQAAGTPAPGGWVMTDARVYSHSMVPGGFEVTS